MFNVFKWLNDRKRDETKLSWSWKFSGPDAGSDKCMECSVERRIHGREHKFSEAKKGKER